VYKKLTVFLKSGRAFQAEGLSSCRLRVQKSVRLANERPINALCCLLLMLVSTPLRIQ